jgi:DOPA 4,5-dioxygenase
MTTPLSLADIKTYHAHVYYDALTRVSAEALRNHLMEISRGRLEIYTLSDGPRGPHITPMFGVDIPAEALPEILGVLMTRHGPHSVLIHPVTGNELLDHTHHALWLGQPQPLNLAVLV